MSPLTNSPPLLFDVLRETIVTELAQARWDLLTPLERAEELRARGVDVREWGDAELDAYCATFPPIEGMDSLSDAELDQIIEAPESPEGKAILDRLGISLGA